MLRKLEAIARQLESFNIIFEDSEFERFLTKYAIETMLTEGIQVNGKQTGYMKYLICRKAEDMLRITSLMSHFMIGGSILIPEFHTDSEIKEMVRREHAYGIRDRRSYCQSP
jgi:hypothetical protein